jgi:hypothetical protein
MELEPEAPRPSCLQLLEDEDFVWSRVCPTVSGGESAPPGATFSVTVHRLREDGRAVTEYRFEDGSRVFAKLYPDDAAGRAVSRIHDELCRHGFVPGSIHRVPERSAQVVGAPFEVHAHHPARRGSSHPHASD